MKDIVGREISVNDKVVFGSAKSKHLRTGEIIKINEKTVLVAHEECKNDSYSTIKKSLRQPCDVVVIK